MSRKFIAILFLILLQFFGVSHFVVYGDEEPIASGSSSLQVETESESAVPIASVSADVDITTNSATSSTQVSNEVNTNLIGNDQTQTENQIWQPQHGDLNLSDQSLPTQSTSSSLAIDQITVENTASVSTQLNLATETGENQISGNETSIETGSALSSAQVFNSLNTTQIGDCNYFGIINLWAPLKGNLILPNQDEYLNCAQSQPLAASNSADITVENQASSRSGVNLSATTGNNQVQGEGDVKTGEVMTNSQIIDHTNTTFIGDDWWLVRVTNPNYWQGSLEGGSSQAFQVGNELYLGWQIPSQPQKTNLSASQISVQNSADLQNQIHLTADTGHNLAKGNFNQITTGSASAFAQLINYVNTTLVGNRWYLADVNLLAPFTGNIVLAKPDLAIVSLVNNLQLQVGQPQAIGFRISNLGQSRAKNVKVVVQLPAGISSIESQPKANLDGQTLTWQLNELNPQQTQDFLILIKPEKVMDVTHISAQVSGELSEISTENNQVTFSFVVHEMPVPVVAAQTVVATPQPTYKRIPKVIKKNVQPEQSPVAGKVLGITTGGACFPKASTTAASTQPRGQTLCQKDPELCKYTQYGVASFMSSIYFQKKRKRWKFV